VESEGTHPWRDAFGGRAGSVLLVVSLAWLLTIGARIVYPAVMPGIQAEFGFGYTVVGALVGAVWGAYALMQFPGGLLADVRSDRFAIVTGLCVTAAGIAVLFTSNVFALFVMGTLVMGAGTGVMGPSRVAVLVNAYPRVQSTAVAISQGAGTLGNAVLPVIAGVLMGWVGWRFGLGMLVPLLMLVAVGAGITVPSRHSEPVEDGLTTIVRDSVRALLARAPLLGTLTMLGVMLVFQSLTGFLPTFFTDVAGLSTTHGAMLFGLFFASGLFMQLCSGILADRRGPAETIGFFAALSIPGVVLILAADELVLLGVGVILASAVLGCLPPGLSYLVSVFPVTVQGSGFGIVRTLYIGGGAVGPVAVGAVADWVSLWAAFVGIPIVLTVLVALTKFLPTQSDTQPKSRVGNAQESAQSN